MYLLTDFSFLAELPIKLFLLNTFGHVNIVHQ